MKKYSLFGIIFLLFFLSFYDSAISKNLYVNGTTGNDGWNGESPVWTSGNNGPLKSIQKAIDLSTSNDQIFISPGIYRENLNITHQLILQGSGNGQDSVSNTILLSPNYGNGTGINISFSTTTNLPSRISKLRVSGFYTGIVLSRDVIYYDMTVTGNYYGFSNGGNNYLRDLQLIRCKATFNKVAGLQINHACSVIAFIIDSCEFSDNFGGIYAYCDNPATSNIIDFLLKNTSFRRNLQKGIYVEKLDNSIFENLYFDSCGIDSTYNWNAGIDINLKYNNYQNISILNSEFYYCGIGGGNNSGCAMVVKARDDGSVYGANPATLTGVKIKGLIVKYCKNGLIFGEPGKNNFGPAQITVHESQIVLNQKINVISNIRSDVAMHNNCWLSAYGPASGDTLHNNSGKLLIYTWIKNTIDRKSTMGFQSDSIVWFDKNTGHLQKAIDVTPFAWTLFIPSKFYTGSYHVYSRINFSPENYVHIQTLHLDALSELQLVNNDLYISDSLFMHTNAYFSTGEKWQAELSDSCIIKEDSGFVVEGRVRTFRNLKGSPAVENFGGLGLTVKANVNATFPYNNIVVIRHTGFAAAEVNKKVLRSYEILTHQNCGWQAELSFCYDQTEKNPLTSDSGLILMRSYNNGKTWLLTGGNHDTNLNIITINNADYLQALWTFTDSSGKIFPPGIAVSSRINPIDCFGNKNGKITTQVEGGFPPYHYNWSTGDTLDFIDSLSAGTYYLSVQDTGGCTAYDSFIISEPLPLSLSFKHTDIRCHGDKNGSAEVLVTGGIPPYDIHWKEGEKTPEITGKAAGWYFVSIADSNGCTKNDSVRISQPEPFSFHEEIKQISCFGKNDGSITLNPTGGTPPYVIFWSTGQSGNSITNLKPGIYNFSIFDSFFCMGGDTFTITEPSPLKLQLHVRHLKCYGEADGEIKVTVEGGTPPYSLWWNDHDTSFQRTKLQAGKYVLQLTDYHQCTLSDSAEVTQPAPLNINFTVKHDTNQKCIGFIQAQVSGGTPPYLAEWNDPLQQKGFTANGLCPGIYTLYVMDSNQCSYADSTEIQNIINPGTEKYGCFDFKVFPVPFSDFLVISAPDFITRLSIINHEGKLMAEFSNIPSSFSFSTAGFEKGIYYLILTTQKNIYYQKLIKIR